MRIIHTADWQIGKSFRRFGEQEELFRTARLTAIESIGKLAEVQGVVHVLVAGDIYDNDAPSPKTLREPLERMRGFQKVRWHLLPGNHDPHRPKGVWDRVREAPPPPNVHLHLTPQPVDLESNVVLLPAPLTHKSEGRDLTEWMDEATTPHASIRIGLAHGSVIGFGTDGEASNPIAPTRPQSAGLSYLALGDWHRTVEVGPLMWYAGTPEPDRAGSQEEGQVLLVELEGSGAPPCVTPYSVGSYRWLTREERLEDTADLKDFETSLRALPDLSATVLRLILKGILPLSGLADLRQRCEGLEAALLHLEVDDEELATRPTEADLEMIDFGGVLRDAAERLQAMAADISRDSDERHRAEDALVELYLRVTADRKSHGAAA